MTHSDGGKGDKQRPTNKEAYDKHYEEIFRKKKEEKPQQPSPQQVSK